MRRSAVDDVVGALERAPAMVIPLARQAPSETRRRRPPSNKWSIHEHVVHLADVDALMARRLDVMLSAADPVIRSYDPGRDDPADRLLQIDFEDALARYARDRTELVARLRRLTVAQWRRTAHHEEYNSYSVFTMFRHLSLHDFFHAYRIEELILRRDWPVPLDLLLE